MIEEFSDHRSDESDQMSDWSPPTWQRVTPDELVKYIWCPGCAIPATVSLVSFPKTIPHICDKKGGK
jgi:hypothetical protein